MARRARKRRAGARPSAPPRATAPPSAPRAASPPPAGLPETNGHRGSSPGETISRSHHAISAGGHRAVSAGGAVSDRNHRAVSPGEAESPREAMARGYARARAKDEAAREALVPLAPGERPWPIVVSVVLATVFAVANVVLVVVGWDADTSVASPLIFSAVMLVAAAGMWQLKYWAVLGWEVLLGVTFIGALLSLLRASNAYGVILAVAVMALSGPLFYSLIRQMARIQMPKRK